MAVDLVIALSGKEPIAPGLRIKQTSGPTWDECEAKYIVRQPATDLGGWRRGVAFPGVPSFWITDIEAVEVGPTVSEVTIRGQGLKDGRQKVFNSVSTYAHSEQHDNVKINGQTWHPSPLTTSDTWPLADLFLPSLGFEQIIVGLPGSGTLPPAAVRNVGYAQGAPLIGAFPQAPANPWTSANNPILHYPFNWVMARADCSQLITPGSGSPGVNLWIGQFGWAYRWRLTPS